MMVQRAWRLPHGRRSNGAAVVGVQPGTGAEPGADRSSGHDALEHERARLARELHDGPAQLLTNLALHLELVERLIDLDSAQAKEELRLLQAEVRAATEETRRFISDLVPPALLTEDLMAVVQGLCDRLQQRSGLLIHRDVGPIPSPPPKARLTIVRVIQEALQNVLRHSGTQEAWLGLAYRDGVVMVTIQDRGSGFDPTDPKLQDGHRLGLVGMRERARLSGGSLTTNSRPGEGTRVVLCLPVEGE